MLAILRVTSLLVYAEPDQTIPWSFHPVQRFESGSIDALIDTQLEQQGLTPNPKVDRYALIRRATFDLLGLPPTPEETLAFVEDPSHDAYDRLIEYLLASPRYGERWGRYWLDLARYADTNGADENMSYPNAWRYRDYVIRSFNQDKPYDQFIREQLAGDLLSKTSDAEVIADRLIATGFLVLGPKMLAEQDKEKLLMDVVDEQIDVITRTFMGISVACARCHDHKFDPVAQEDYYALAGIFRSTKTMANTNHVSRWTECVLPHPGNAQLEKEFAAKKEALESQIDTLKSAAGSDTTQKQLKELQNQLKSLKEKGPGLPQAMSVKEGDIQDLPVHLRGNHLTPTKDAVPRENFSVLSHLVPMPDIGNQTSGRLALAEWMCDPKHTLTARVMVNRIWKGHFGIGLVETPSNFGGRGSLPNHPQLLDWLAQTFVEEGWSVKAMHRLMMKSDAYQRKSTADSQNLSLDPENHYMWRQNRRRLEVEPMRDALLQVGGMLDTRYGDALSAAIKESQTYYRGEDDVFESPVRSVYLPVLRSRVFDMFATFDFPDASAHLEKRSETVMPQQALFYMNSKLINQVTRLVAEQVVSENYTSLEAALNRLYLTLFSRYPDPEELDLASDYFKQTASQSGDIVPLEGMGRWVRVLLASNEFSYVE